MLRLRPVRALALWLLTAVAQAQVVLSNFNVNDEGWLAYAGADPTTGAIQRGQAVRCSQAN